MKLRENYPIFVVTKFRKFDKITLLHYFLKI
ncbi:hypothetical protein JOC95_002325 [Bacillus tianshenii]|uniref:Uncharacterized protein n=1 Tax=Sutcliffiella tianshenii TaxID=1463404 RepID=A0ABS2P0I2_9BACI|nr:hypothetical protein [Bacillus tianshenii]